MSKNKTNQEIKVEYASLLRASIVISCILILLILPRLIIGFTSLNTFLGLTYASALIPLAIGVIICVVFYFKYWRCPACNKLPGDSWSRKTCKNCNVELK